jgi:hypothetical protein
VAIGHPLGIGPRPISRQSPLGPRPALEAAVLAALRRPPCAIGFSGGRDSSALLAVAVVLARREGLAAPIPVTLEFESEATRETGWQEQVVAHLGVDDWVRLPLSDELDLIGETAAEGLRRHGVRYPANAHLVTPLARVASGGSVLTGVGGDAVFGEWNWNDVASLMACRRRARMADVRRMGHWLLPAAARVQVARRREPEVLHPWLRNPLRRRATVALLREQARAPRTWGHRMRWLARGRAWRVTARSLVALGGDEGAVVHSPFLDDGFLEALAVAGGWWGWGNRTSTMRALFGDLLPESILRRSTKAEFSEPFFASATKRLAREWDGRTGIDERLIDGEILRRIWLSPQPAYLSSTLLQATWLAVDAERRAPGASLEHAL